MRSVWWATGVALVLATGAASANPLDDAKAGMKAFDKGDNQAAVKLFTSAIGSHRLQRSDQELALVKRAEARIALGQGQAALADAYSALNLDPADNEAIATRDRAQAMLNPPPPASAAVTAPAEPSAYLKSQAAYQDALKHYEEQKNADAKRYDDQLAKYNAELKAQQEHDAQAAALRSAQGGSQPAPAPKPPVQAATQPAPPSKPKAKAEAQPAPVSKPTVQATAAPKAVAKPTQKKPSKATPAPDDRPRFY